MSTVSDCCNKDKTLNCLRIVPLLLLVQLAFRSDASRPCHYPNPAALSSHPLQNFHSSCSSFSHQLSTQDLQPATRKQHAGKPCCLRLSNTVPSGFGSFARLGASGFPLVGRLLFASLVLVASRGFLSQLVLLLSLPLPLSLPFPLPSSTHKFLSRLPHRPTPTSYISHHAFNTKVFPAFTPRLFPCIFFLALFCLRPT